MNGNNTTAWKEVKHKRQTKGKKKNMSKLAQAKGPSGMKYEGMTGMVVKQEEIDSALVEKCPTPKRKRGSSDEVIILDEDGDSKMDIESKTEPGEEVISVESSEDDEVLKKLPAPKRTKGRSFVNFMDYDSDDDEEEEDDNMVFDNNAWDANDAND